MYLVATTRWTCAQLLRQPWFWVWTALMFAAWPMIVHLTPLGISSESGSDGRTLYEVAFIGGLIGCMQACVALGGVRWLIHSQPLSKRLGLVATMLATSTLLTAGTALLPACLLGQLSAVTYDPLHLLAALAHLVAVALVVDSLPIHTSARVALLPLLVWILPALLAGAEGIGQWVGHCLDAHARLPRLESGTDSKGTDWKAILGPIIGCPALLVLCIRTPRLLHALRDPR